MRLRHLLRAAFAALAVAATPAMAQNCAGFTDVLASSGFCTAVEWVKNRTITTGCGGTSYCPNDAVSRIGMAAFLQRLGDRLTPSILPVVAVDSAVQHNLASPAVVCPTGDYAVANYPRRALFNGRVNLYNPSANGDFISEMVYDDDGLGWKAVQNTSAYQTLYGGMSPSHDVSTYPQGYLDLDVGKTYKFAMRISRFTGTTANVASYCVNLVTIANRNGASSPYDEAYTPPADAMPPMGRAAPRQ